MIVLIATVVLAGSDLVADSDAPTSRIPAPVEQYFLDSAKIVADDPAGTRILDTDDEIGASSLEDLSLLQSWSGFDQEGHIALDINMRESSSNHPSLAAFDPSASDEIPQLTASVEGISDAWDDIVNGTGLGIPPDPMIAVGHDHIVTVVNNSMEIHSTTGTFLASVGFPTFFASISLAATPFDPKVRYDQYRDRFIVVVLDGKSSTARTIPNPPGRVR